MNPTVTIRAKDLGKAFRYYDKKWNQLRNALFRSGNHAQDFWALRNLNLELAKGTTLGIIGQNGSGKTTLLQLLAGLLKPTEGQADVHGNLATLLELEGGFQHDLTGRENIFVSCGLRGFSRRNVEKRIDGIIEFAELEKFIDHPIKHYSSGMVMRLAFATAINVEPDVLLIDEVFAVGDMAFQHKCAKKFRELQSRGTTIVLATHDMAAVKSLCHEAILLDGGQTVIQGDPEAVTNRYINLIADRIAKLEVREELPQHRIGNRHGTSEAQICSIELLKDGHRTETVSMGDEVTFQFGIEYFTAVTESILGFYIRDRYGNDLIGINTHEEGKSIGAMKKGERLVIEFRLRLFLRPGSYSISPGLAYHPTEMRYLDWIDNAAVFLVENPTSRRIHGFFWVPNEIIIRKI